MNAWLLALMLAIVTCTSCSDPPKPAHPDQKYAGQGYVLIVDWGERTFVIQQDDGVLVTAKSCLGQMPVWKGEHIRLHAHTSYNSWLQRYEYCQYFDWVQRIGPDLAEKRQ